MPKLHLTNDDIQFLLDVLNLYLTRDITETEKQKAEKIVQALEFYKT